VTGLRIAYRARQFVGALVAAVRPVDASAVRVYLSPAETELFLRQDLAVQRHSVTVLTRVRGMGCCDTVLEKAALLHDVGKSGGRIRLWHRVAKVLLDTSWAKWSERLASDDPDSWRYPFHVQAHHAALGAKMVRQVGGSSELVALIADHHTAVQETRWLGLDARRLSMLQRADMSV
jgi:putative nucleotidyltransferase with HDIG domain